MITVCTLDPDELFAVIALDILQLPVRALRALGMRKDIVFAPFNTGT